MAPHLRYAQAVHGRSTGRGVGVIDTIHLVEVARAIECWSPRRPLDGRARGRPALVRRVPAVDDHGPNGIEERDAKNNHGTCWVMQAAAYARLTGDEDRLAFCASASARCSCRARWPRTELPARDGPHQALRLLALQPRRDGHVAQILSTPRDDLWRFELPDGRGLRRAVSWMVPFVRSRKGWPFPPDVMYDDQWPMRQAALLFAGLAYGERDWIELWKTLPATRRWTRSSGTSSCGSRCSGWKTAPGRAEGRHLSESAPQLLQQLRGSLDLLEQPQQVAHVGVDVAGHVGVVAEVVGHVLPDAVEVDADEAALAVDRGAARVAAGRVAIAEDPDRHLATAGRPSGRSASRRRPRARAAAGRTGPRRCASPRRRRASSAGHGHRLARRVARTRPNVTRSELLASGATGRPASAMTAFLQAGRRRRVAPAAASRRSLRAFFSASRAKPRSTRGSLRAFRPGRLVEHRLARREVEDGDEA